MLYKTRGIALSYIRYKESSIIARIFTETFGMQSYIVNGIRSKNAKTRIALFQPLTMLDLVVYNNNKKDINRISEIKSDFSFHTIPYDIKKTTIALFITELLNQTLREEGENESLFVFIRQSFLTFDLMIENYENFHLQFMFLLCTYLGIKPVSAQSMLKEVGHSKTFDLQFIEQVSFFLKNSSYGNHLPLNKSSRMAILLLIIDYYRYHFDVIKEFKSVQVLKEVFS